MDEDARQRLLDAASDFRSWLTEHDGEPDGDELAYPGWDTAMSAFRGFIRCGPVESWDDDAVQAVLYLIALDNESEVLCEDVADSPSLLLFLAERALHRADPDCRWQLAAALGGLSEHTTQAERLLLAYAQDADEYVRRRAIMALERLGSRHLEEVAISAWTTEHEYQRIAVLWALHAANSPRLPQYLALARSDGRSALVANAAEIEAFRAGNVP